MDQGGRVAQGRARDAGNDRGQEQLRERVGVRHAVAGVGRVEDDLLALDLDVAEMRRAGCGEPLSEPIPVADQLDAVALDRDDGRAAGAIRIGGAD
ncbi:MULTISPECIES: hypothetical protein [unclassified Bradyrhizobium]|uniref:hypothetical protein n=1 Tax=unclassified Bradyrhizobium TaxID=2631580 RepID=UPI001CD2D0F0|nr:MULTISPECIES: hypothetical protein [unclassified Bradyrhizobium]